MKTSRSAFTVIELILVIIIALSSSVLFFSQKNALQVSMRDTQRKTAINAIYYGLENGYYSTNKSYPRTINSGVLPTVDPTLFTDPDGNTVGSSTSDYRYEAEGCEGDTCSGYTLRSNLEGEADYIKNSKN